MFSARTIKTMTSAVAARLKQVQENVKTACLKRPQNLQYVEPLLVAVSKRKELEFVLSGYDAGQRHFGENYVVELHEKATDIEVQDRCQDIKWHFIGHLQRNKVNKLLAVPNLYMIESVDNEKLAKTINDSLARSNRTEPLRVFAQCNTTREDTKSGCAPEEMVQLAEYIVKECPHLKLMGLMTIGSYYYDPSTGPNPAFESLFSLREDVCKVLNVPVEKMGLSMGMTADYEQAIERGSTNIRVGTAIFGPRPKLQPANTENTDTDDSAVNESTKGVKDISIS